MKFPMDPRDG